VTSKRQAIVFIALLLAGCGAQPSKSDSLKNFDQLAGAALYDPENSWAKGQERIAECMRNQGFDYRAEILPIKAMSPVPWLSLQSLAWRRENGFGIAKFRPVRVLIPTNRNIAYIKGLEESQRSAYAEILNGPNGCGSKMVFKPSHDRQSRLRRSLRDLEKRISLDPTMRRITKNWSNCIELAGYRAVDDRELISKYLAPFLGDTQAAGTSSAWSNFEKKEMDVARASIECWEPLWKSVQATRKPFELAFAKRSGTNV
jgi:hypothetical protein